MYDLPLLSEACFQGCAKLWRSCWIYLSMLSWGCKLIIWYGVIGHWELLFISPSDLSMIVCMAISNLAVNSKIPYEMTNWSDVSCWSCLAFYFSLYLLSCVYNLILSQHLPIWFLILFWFDWVELVVILGRESDSRYWGCIGVFAFFFSLTFYAKTNNSETDCFVINHPFGT